MLLNDELPIVKTTNHALRLLATTVDKDMTCSGFPLLPDFWIKKKQLIQVAKLLSTCSGFAHSFKIKI